MHNAGVASVLSRRHTPPGRSGCVADLAKVSLSFPSGARCACWSKRAAGASTARLLHRRGATRQRWPNCTSRAPGPHVPGAAGFNSSVARDRAGDRDTAHVTVESVRWPASYTESEKCVAIHETAGRFVCRGHVSGRWMVDLDLNMEFTQTVPGQLRTSATSQNMESIRPRTRAARSTSTGTV